MRAFYHDAVVEVEGEKLTLVCDFMAITAIEGVTGENWDEIVPQLANPSRTLVVKVLWGLLRRKHEGVTLDEAAGVAFGPNQTAVGIAMGDVIQRACNLAAPKEKDGNPPKRRGRSKASEKLG